MDSGGEPDEDRSPNYKTELDEENVLTSTQEGLIEDEEDDTDASHVDPDDTSTKFGSGTETPDHGSSGVIRRSSRPRKPPTEWWNATALLSSSPEVKLTFNAATKGED